MKEVESAEWTRMRELITDSIWRNFADAMESTISCHSPFRRLLRLTMINNIIIKDELALIE